ncbi:hypothetical protein OGAPHI_007461 [Ogataea philodendri]|uniref:Uncharacterized protein n=1 Tax=Ogataea philodendri TaxID=1378263 RepID=A0A9P8SZB8_9ASCO|nr:uncharacterized protein OGAPHI_007461 [Ogataea philodendri]KAH3660256.1 hypothetical protein OGAPHI_007461 [Ogataea philodendri]
MSATPYRNGQKRSPTTPLTPMVRQNVRRKVEMFEESKDGMELDLHNKNNQIVEAKEPLRTKTSPREQNANTVNGETDKQKLGPSSSPNQSSLALLPIYRRAWLNERKYIRQKELVEFLELERAASEHH